MIKNVQSSYAADFQTTRDSDFLQSNPPTERVGLARLPLPAAGRPHLLVLKWPWDLTILLHLGLICGPGVGPAPMFVLRGMWIVKLIKEILSMKIETEKVRGG